MTIITGLALTILGLAVGFVVAWAFKAGVSTGLATGLLLLVAGAIIGFVTEWLIDEAYRKNRELQRQLRERKDTPITLGDGLTGQNGNPAAETFATFLRQRDEELRQIREQLVVTDKQMDALRDELEAYQQTHPDSLTMIKGIGPVYQWKLRDAGFNTYRQLATANPDQLRRMLGIKKWQRADVESWIEQARDWSQRGP